MSRLLLWPGDAIPPIEWEGRQLFLVIALHEPSRRSWGRVPLLHSDGVIVEARRIDDDDEEGAARARVA